MMYQENLQDYKCDIYRHITLCAPDIVQSQGLFKLVLEDLLMKAFRGSSYLIPA